MAGENRELDVFLGDVPVGRLSFETGGQVGFVFFGTYRDRYPRPVLGQMFEDDLSGHYVGKGQLPVWFSNLLPEGPLRERAQAQLGRRKHELFLLAALADDLPGAVRLVPATDLAGEASGLIYEAQAASHSEGSQRIRFSLAGVQDKFPVRRRLEGGFSLPAGGVAGDWIAKLPDRSYAGVTVNEHAMMTWARLAQMDVPRVGLASEEEIDRVERERFLRGEPAFVIERFDRAPLEGRIHIEDMAQVWGQYPVNRFDRKTYEDIASITRSVAGDSGYDEIIRRLVFMAVSGNCDMHLKNWSLRYVDGVSAQLAPAYDFVATVVYPEHADELALRLARSKRWERVTLESFEYLARQAGADVARTRQLVEQTLDALVTSYGEARDRTSLPAPAWARIAEHWRRVPLLKSLDRLA